MFGISRGWNVANRFTLHFSLAFLSFSYTSESTARILESLGRATGRDRRSLSLLMSLVEFVTAALSFVDCVFIVVRSLHKS